MDLRGLVKLDSKEGFLKKGRNKEEKKDAYKKPGRATNTASEARTLRTLQVQNKRVEKREAQLNRAFFPDSASTGHHPNTCVYTVKCALCRPIQHK